MKDIIIITYGAGGTDSLYKLYKHLKCQEGISVKLLPISKISKDCLKWDCYYSVRDVSQYLHIHKPDIVINECSSGHEDQNYITSLCKGLGIFNIKFLDTYGGYEERFEIEPNLIWSPNHSIGEELASQGLHYEIVGNPAFDNLTPSSREDLFSDKPSILFCSQPLKKYFSNISEFEIFREFYELFKDNFDNFNIDIKLHPEDSKSKWLEFLEEFKNTRIVDFQQSQVYSVLPKYDICCGQDSTLMFKAVYLGVYTIYNESKNIAINNYLNRKNMIEKYERFKPNSIDNMMHSLNSIK